MASPCVAYVGAVGTSEVHATPLSDLPGPAPSTEDSPPKTPKKNRCFVCRKKVGLTGWWVWPLVLQYSGRRVGVTADVAMSEGSVTHWASCL